MPDQPRSTSPLADVPIPDPAKFSQNMIKVATQSQQLLADFLQRQLETGTIKGADPLNIGGAFLDFTQKLAQHPDKLFDAQLRLWKDYAALWRHAVLRSMGLPAEPVAEPEPGDKRFRHPDWDENVVYDFIKQSYLLTTRWLQETVESVEGLDDLTAKKVAFYTRQLADAMAPSNFVLTNPEVLRTTIETNGENLVRGLDNLLRDFERGKGKLAIQMTDMDAFEVGRNLAVTPGKVIFQNDIIQLIQYAPTTETVHKQPLLIIPPWINKFYILDLRPENSFVRWAVERGYTVFIVSWVNPDARLADRTFADYMEEGILAALDAVEQATGEREVSAIGYCIGGTLLAATLAYMAARDDDRIRAATFFAAQTDFTEAGDLRIFIDEAALRHVECLMDEAGGFLDAETMFTTFNMLRANDLIWSFVVNNYLLGKDPFPFDLLYWNADQTRMPKALHLGYLRDCYQNNDLAEGRMVLKGERIDLKRVKIPVYMQASKEDHIAPARSVYKSTQIFTGPTKFVLAGSGHIAGVINPPAAKKYQHWTNDQNPPSFEEWLKGAQEHPGSWWPDWDVWLAEKSGPQVPARQPGDGKLKPIEDAPGSYVKARALGDAAGTSATTPNVEPSGDMPARRGGRAADQKGQTRNRQAKSQAR